MLDHPVKCYSLVRHLLVLCAIGSQVNDFIGAMVLPREVQSVAEAGFFGSGIIPGASREQGFGQDFENTVWTAATWRILCENRRCMAKQEKRPGRGR